MSESKLILAIPQGSLIATSLDVEGFARHRSPGAGRYFEGKAVYVEVAVADGKPAFAFSEEGGWRDCASDTEAALRSVANQRKRTKTALSNGAFNVVPSTAFVAVCLAKTGGQTLPLHTEAGPIRFASHSYEWGKGLSADEVARAGGFAVPAQRTPRLYMILAPIELVVLSNLSPEEYAWYATHRPGKLFRQVMFTEIEPSGRGLVADALFDEARQALVANPSKKTKTVYTGSALHRVPYQSWIGYRGGQPGGIYIGDRDQVALWRFPATSPTAWERAE
jgi:hypothetical protein